MNRNLKKDEEHAKQSKKKGVVNRIIGLVVMTVVLNDGFCYSSYSSNSALVPSKGSDCLAIKAQFGSQKFWKPSFNSLMG